MYPVPLWLLPNLPLAIGLVRAEHLVLYGVPARKLSELTSRLLGLS